MQCGDDYFYLIENYSSWVVMILLLNVFYESCIEIKCWQQRWAITNVVQLKYGHCELGLHLFCNCEGWVLQFYSVVVCWSVRLA